MVVNHWQFDSWKTTQQLILIKSLIIQVSFLNKSFLKNNSSSVHQSRSLSINLKGFFIDNIYTLWSFGFPPQFFSSFRRFFINLSLVRFSSLVFSSSVWEVFYQQYDPLRLISFPTGLGCSQWFLGFPPCSPSSDWEIFYLVCISLWQFHT